MKKSTEKTPDFTPTKSPRTCKDAIYVFLRETVASQRIKPLRPHPGKGHRTPVRRKHHPCGEAIRKLEGEGYTLAQIQSKVLQYPGKRIASCARPGVPKKSTESHRKILDAVKPEKSKRFKRSAGVIGVLSPDR